MNRPRLSVLADKNILQPLNLFSRWNDENFMLRGNKKRLVLLLK